MAPSKEEVIRERQSNLPLPDQPPTASDWNSADARNVNIGSEPIKSSINSGGRGSDSLRGPATAGSDVREDGAEMLKNTAGSDVGRQAADNLEGLPNDAVTREKKDLKGLAQTTK